MKKHAFISIFFLFNSLFLLSQENDKISILNILSQDKPYWEKTKIVDSIVSNFDTSVYSKAEYKRYFRYMAFCNSRVDSLGTMTGYKRSWSQMLKNLATKTSINLNYENVGPFESNMYENNAIGRLERIYTAPDNTNEVYLGTASSGLWRTNDISQTSPIWENLTPDFGSVGIFGLDFDPNDPNIIYIATGNKVWEAYNSDGEWGLGVFKLNSLGNWEPILEFVPEDKIMLKDIRIRPIDGRIFVLTNNSIWISDNDGFSWVEVILPSNNEWYKRITLNPNNSNEIMVAGENSLSKSTDGGWTWVDLVPNFYSGSYCGSSGLVKYTPNTGSEWRSLSLINQSTFKSVHYFSEQNAYMVGENGTIYCLQQKGEMRYNGIAYFLSGYTGMLNSVFGIRLVRQVGNDDYVFKNNIITVGSNNAIYRSVEGTGFENINTTPQISGDFNSCIIFNNHDVVIVGNNGLIFRSTNALFGDAINVTYNQALSGITENINYIHRPERIVSSELSICVGNNGRILRSINKGVNWSIISSGTTQNLNCVHFYNESIAYIVGNNGIILKSTNGGITWSQKFSGTNSKLNAVWFIDENTGFCGGDGGLMLKTTDGGESWVTNNSNTTNNINSICFPQQYERFSIAFNQVQQTYYAFTVSGTSFDRLYKFENNYWKYLFTYNSKTLAPNYVWGISISSNGSIFLGGLNYSKYIEGEPFDLTTNEVGISMHDDIRDISFANGTDAVMYIATDGGVSKVLGSNINSQTSKNGNLSLLQIPGFGISYLSPQNLIFGASDNYTWEYDKVVSKFKKKYEGDGGFSVYSNQFANGKFGKVGADINGLRILGVNSNNILEPLTGTSSHFSPFAYHPQYNYAYADNKLYSNDYAKLIKIEYVTSTPIITNVIDQNQSKGKITSIALCEKDPENLIYSSFYENSIERSGHIMLSVNNGATFTEISDNIPGYQAVLPYAPTSDIEFHPENANTFWVVFSRFVNDKKVFVTYDKGQTFTNITYNLENMAVNSVCYDQYNHRLFLGTDFGMYYLNDNTTTWLKDPDCPTMIITDIKINKTTNEMLFSTLGRSLWKVQLPCSSPSGELSVWESQTWEESRKLCGDLIVEENAVLETSDLKMANTSSILVKQGASLKLNGSISDWNDDPWIGEITVENGGTLEMLSSSGISIKSTGFIQINSGATFKVNPGSSLVLTDNDTKLEIAGTLNIAQNATFTFIGNGYIKFSSQLATSENITAGTGSSIDLVGTGQTDVVVEIAQEGFYIPVNVANFNVQNARIYMQNNTARIVVKDGSTVINIDNVKFTPQTSTRTGHRGLQVFGQANCTINNCYFEKGIYGIYAYLTYFGSPIEITNCSFNDCQYGIWAHDKEIRAIYCSFNYCTYGLWAENMSFTNSKIEDCGFMYNSYGAYYTGGSGANLYVNRSIIGYSTNYGLLSTGSFTSTIRCSDIYLSGTYGIIASNSNILNMSEDYTLQGGKSGVFNCTSPNIQLYNAVDIRLNNGYNRITKQSGYKISGTLADACGRTRALQARNNQWFYPTNAQPVQNIDYYITKYSCFPFELFQFSPVLPLSNYVACEGGGGGTMAIGGGEEELAISDIEQSAINNALENEDYETALNYYYNEMFSTVQTQISSTQNKDFETIWEGMKYCFGKIRNQSPITTNAGGLVFNKIEQGLNKMKQINIGNPKRLFFLELEHATFYRSVGDDNTAIQKINSLLTSLTDEEEIAQAENWLCIIQTEKEIKLGNIPPQDIEEYTYYCDGNNTAKSQITNNITSTETHSTNEIVLSIVPNPVTSNSEIIVELPLNNSATVEIIDIEGKTIKSYNVTVQETRIGIRANDLPKGIYTVKLFTSLGLTKTARMIIQ